MISGREFLTLAEAWSLGNHEAVWRCAVSRAYYAAFHESRGLLTDLGFDVPRADMAHAFLWKRLENSGVPALAKVGANLSFLRRERNRADYDIHLNLTQPTALKSVAVATDMISSLNRLSDADRQQATEAMRAYERDVLRETTWRNRPR